MKETFPAGNTLGRWKIPFFHHPVFCKGPMHGDSQALRHLVGLFQGAGVKRRRPQATSTTTSTSSTSAFITS